MRAEEIYKRAEELGVEFETSCVGISINKWDKLMEGSTRADEKKITKILVEQGHMDKDMGKLYNPYHHYKTETHLIYVHSSIEHFYKINDG